MIDLATPINTLKQDLEKIHLDEQNTPTYEKLRVLIPILENYVNGTGVMVCNPTYLNNISSYLSSIQECVRGDISAPSSNHYINIPAQIDNIVAQLQHIPLTNKADIKQSLSQIVGTYKKQNDNVIEKIKEEKDQLEKAVSSLKQKVASLETQITNKETELTNLSENFKQQFNSSQNSRDQHFRTKLDNTLRIWDEAGQKYSEKIQDNETEIQKKFDEKYEALEKQTNTIVKYLEERKEEIKKIYGLIGDMVSCGEYKKYANDEHETANTMFWTSFGLFCTAATVMIIATIVELFNKNDFSWWTILTRLPIALVILLPAFYTAIEARKRRNQEIELRDFEIKMANIDPYLKNIDFVETERETSGKPIPEGAKTARDLKIELAKEFFSIKQVKDTDNIVFPKDTIEFVEKLMAFCDRKEK